MSSQTALQAAEILKNKGAHFLDCPVSGGVEGARKGTLAMMVGGEQAILDKARGTLAAITGTYTPGFKVNLHHKDLTICQKMADTSLPIVAMTLAHYQQLMDDGYADEDISALFRIKYQ